MTLLYTRPLRREEEKIVETFLRKYEFKPEMITKLLRIIQKVGDALDSIEVV
jgi:hypothetical protein